MKRRLTVGKVVGVLLLGLCAISGCGGGSVDTGPAEEPNIGPGVPADGSLPTAASKTSGSSSPSSAPAAASKK